MGNTLRRCQMWLHQNVWRAQGVDLGVLDDDSKDSAPSDMPSQQSFQSTTEPLPYSQNFALTALPGDNVLFRARTEISIRTAICVAAVNGGPAVARAVATVITQVSHSVAGVPAAERPVAATVITTAVTKYAALAAEEPGTPSGTIYHQALNSVPAASVPALSEGLLEALGHIDYAISSTEGWSRVSLAATIAHAVAEATDAVIVPSPEGGQFIADSYSKCASTMAANVDHRIHRASSSSRPLPNPVGSKHPSPEATACICSETPGSREAVLQSNRLRAALYALWSYNAVVGNCEAVRALAAVATAAGLPPPRGFPDIGQDADDRRHMR